jgi:hypothetical protein
MWLKRLKPVGTGLLKITGIDGRAMIFHWSLPSPNNGMGMDGLEVHVPTDLGVARVHVSIVESEIELREQRPHVRRGVAQFMGDLREAFVLGVGSARKIPMSRLVWLMRASHQRQRGNEQHCHHETRQTRSGSDVHSSAPPERNSKNAGSFCAIIAISMPESQA